jgi:MSHA pilin protein MshA
VNSKVRQGGFTLIELVVVITILGILAAFAVPRFASLEGQAREAATQALAGSVRSGASLAHALWLAQGDPASVAVTMEGAPITILNGYPNAATIDDTLVEYTGFGLTAGATTVFTKLTPGNPGTPIANCTVTYTPAAANGAPGVATDLSGC